MTGPAAAATATSPAYAFLPADTRARCEAMVPAATATVTIRRAIRMLADRGVRDASRWVHATLMALCANDLPTGPAHSALVLALIEKESSFDPHGLLPGQPEPVRRLALRLTRDLLEGDDQALRSQFGHSAGAEIADAILSVLYRLGLVTVDGAMSRFDQYYGRYDWSRIRTEWDVEQSLARDLPRLKNEPGLVGAALRALFLARPAIEERFRSGAVFNSIGAMQVNPEHAMRYAKEDGQDVNEARIRVWLYTPEAGVYYGTRRLRPLVLARSLGSDCDRRAAHDVAVDWASGPFRARNTALVEQLGRLTGRELPHDIELDDDRVQRALATLLHDHGEDDAARAEFVQLRFARGLEHSVAYRAVKERYRERFGVPAAYETPPNICRYSPKNGRVCVSDVARRVADRFAEICQQLDVDRSS